MIPALQNLTGGARLLLDLLWRQGPLSRAQLASLTGFTRPAITNIAVELLDRGLLTELQSQKGARGQPARPLALASDAAYSIGISFSTSYGEVGIVDFAGQMVGRAKFPLAAPAPEAIGEAAVYEIDALCLRHNIPRSRQLGVGIAIPTDFDVDGVALAHPLFPELAGEGLAERFASGLDRPVWIENDGRAAAIGERLMGVGANCATFMLVHIGHGVGGGLIIDGQPYRGAWGNAGILGQYYPYGAPRPSGHDLLETLRAGGFAATDFDWLEDAPAEAGTVISAWVARAAAQLSGDLARISRFFGPSAVILTGRLSPAIIADLAGSVDFESVLRPLDNLPIPPLLASRMGPAAGVIGAAAVPIIRALQTDRRSPVQGGGALAPVPGRGASIDEKSRPRGK